MQGRDADDRRGRYFAFGVCIESALPLAGPCATDAKPDVYIVHDESVRGDSHLHVTHRSGAAQADAVTLGRLDGDPVIRLAGEIEIDLIAPSRVRLALLTPLPIARLAHYGLDMGVPLLLSLGGMTVLHAACVVIAGNATAILGGSRSGKSTLAVAVARRSGLLLSDDITVVRSGYAIPSYPMIRLWPSSLTMLIGRDDAGEPIWPGAHKRRLSPAELSINFTGDATPITTVIVVDGHADGQPILEPMGGAELSIALLTNAFRAVVDESRREVDEISRVTYLASSVRGFRLHVPDSPALLSASADLVMKASSS